MNKTEVSITDAFEMGKLVGAQKVLQDLLNTDNLYYSLRLYVEDALVEINNQLKKVSVKTDA